MMNAQEEAILGVPLDRTKSAPRGDNKLTSAMTGRVWCGPKVENDDNLILKWKSAGHFLLDKISGENANEILVTDFASGRQHTGRQLREKVLAVACALIDVHNFKPGTMVCLSYDNSDHLLILALGVLVAGGTISCAYDKDPYAELLYLAKKVEPRFLFCHSKNLRWAEQLTADLGVEVIGIAMDGLPAATDHGAPSSFGCFDALVAYDYQHKSDTAQRVPVALTRPLDKQAAIITMSSGTTGRPKAVAQTHWNCIAELSTMRSNQKNSSFVCCASLDYISGRLIMLGALNSGYNAIILNGFDPATYLAAIERHRAQIIYLGGASFYKLIKYERLDQYDISSISCVFPMGAKIIYLDELREFFAKHPHIARVRQGFGCSETSGAAMNSMTPDEYLRDCDNCGHLLPGMRAKIVDQHTGQLLGPNEVGILHLKGITVFRGYYDLERSRKLRKQKLTLKANEMNGNEVGAAMSDDGDDGDDDDPYYVEESIFDSEGFYITGDLAYFNDQEQLYLIGRQKELMSCRGAKKVLPQELEEVVGAHPAVAEVCVLGVQSRLELLLDCPRAFMVVEQEWRDKPEAKLQPWPLLETPNINYRDDGEALKDELHHVGVHKLSTMDLQRRHRIAEDVLDFVNERIGWEKQLTGGIVILDHIPTSRATGKMNKNYLRQLDLDQIEIYGDQSGQSRHLHNHHLTNYS